VDTPLGQTIGLYEAAVKGMSPASTVPSLVGALALKYRMD